MSNSNPIVIDDYDDGDAMQIEQSVAVPDHSSHPHQIQQQIGDSSPATSATEYAFSSAERTTSSEARVRGHERELRHAALTVLQDRELLTIKALAANESISQARRRFQARMLAPDNPSVEAEIRADLFVLPLGGGEVSTVRRGIIDVSEEGDGGWLRDASGKGKRKVSSRVHSQSS